jgi:hypothetical protein
MYKLLFELNLLHKLWFDAFLFVELQNDRPKNLKFGLNHYRFRLSNYRHIDIWQQRVASSPLTVLRVLALQLFIIFWGLGEMAVKHLLRTKSKIFG